MAVNLNAETSTKKGFRVRAFVVKGLPWIIYVYECINVIRCRFLPGARDVSLKCTPLAQPAILRILSTRCMWCSSSLAFPFSLLKRFRKGFVDGPWKLTGHVEWVCGLCACLPGPLQTLRDGRICSLPPAFPFNKLSSLSFFPLFLSLLPCLVAFWAVPHTCCWQVTGQKTIKPKKNKSHTSIFTILRNKWTTSCCLLVHQSPARSLEVAQENPSR